MANWSRLSFTKQLFDAADGIDDLSRSELQALLRRAALRIDNEDAGSIRLDRELTELFGAIAASVDPPVSLAEMVSAVLADWAIAEGYVENWRLEEESQEKPR